MKTKSLEEHDPSKSVFDVASYLRHHPLSKTTLFADISNPVEVVIVIAVVTKRSFAIVRDEEIL